MWSLRRSKSWPPANAPGRQPARPSPEPSFAAGPRHSGRPLGNLLVARGHLVDDELKAALRYQAASGRKLGEIVVEMGLISDRILAELLAEQLRLPAIDLAQARIDRSVARSIPYEDARRMGAMPLRRGSNWIAVATADPTDSDMVERLTEMLDTPPRLFVAPLAAVLDAIEEAWRD